MFEKAEKILSLAIKSSTDIAVAVSGGEDSMCLLSFVLSCPFIDKERVRVVNIDHKIRANSGDDSAFVRDYCHEKKVGFLPYVVDVPKICASTGQNMELAARNARRSIFSALKESGAVQYVLTAHHASDQAETVLLHLFRGSGLKGLCGMKVKSEGYLLRPFLTTAKEEISAYVHENKIPFVIDQSNDDINYDRNFIRKILMPQINSRWQGFSKNLSGTCDILSSYRDLASAYFEQGDVAKQEDCVKIHMRVFDYPRAAAAEMLFDAMKKAGKDEDVESKHIDLLFSAAKGQNGKRVCLGQGVTAVKEYDYLTLIHGEFISAAGEEVPFQLGKMTLKDYTVEVTPTQMTPQAGQLIFDYDKIQPGAVLRFRRDGDVFKPFGSGSKKLKEYFIDSKIPLRIRDKIPCLCYNNTVLAVMGVQISDDIKIDAETKRAVKAETTRIKEYES